MEVFWELVVEEETVVHLKVVIWYGCLCLQGNLVTLLKQN